LIETILVIFIIIFLNNHCSGEKELKETEFILQKKIEISESTKELFEKLKLHLDKKKRIVEKLLKIEKELEGFSNSPELCINRSDKKGALAEHLHLKALKHTSDSIGSSLQSFGSIRECADVEPFSFDENTPPSDYKLKTFHNATSLETVDDECDEFSPNQSIIAPLNPIIQLHQIPEHPLFPNTNTKNPREEDEKDISFSTLERNVRAITTAGGLPHIPLLSAESPTHSHHPPLQPQRPKPKDDYFGILTPSIAKASSSECRTLVEEKDKKVLQQSLSIDSCQIGKHLINRLMTKTFNIEEDYNASTPVSPSPERAYSKNFKNCAFFISVGEAKMGDKRENGENGDLDEEGALGKSRNRFRLSKAPSMDVLPSYKVKDEFPSPKKVFESVLNHRASLDSDIFRDDEPLSADDEPDQKTYSCIYDYDIPLPFKFFYQNFDDKPNTNKCNKNYLPYRPYGSVSFFFCLIFYRMKYHSLF
jgi:hypothetical protein